MKTSELEEKDTLELLKSENLKETRIMREIDIERLNKFINNPIINEGKGKLLSPLKVFK
ncbi:MAG TPA: hypothetical protein PLW61_00950 [Caldisericia bacterium]|nr:hypothetical protein [Caldisericia bacterium]HOC52599.1 hypothetical protein [Caldisericia bacterium]HPB33324.1 hypothetical protein [Caldisericia bacterium]HQL66663.1 hypothetical protein [Caldisericia bacterium]HQN48093.1 hypothetical protein [Caldisericia bacterium]